MTPASATAAKCSTIPSSRLKVIVAERGILYTEFSCLSCEYNIQGVPFVSDFQILQLKGYDLILGADWIHQHSPVELDYKLMTFKATLSTGETAIFRDETLPQSPRIPESQHINKMLVEAVCGALVMIKPVQYCSSSDNRVSKGNTKSAHRVQIHI